jgi:predicted acylesterase/phospholipase RssA
MDGSGSKIGVALSGGGHRATLFGLGVLLYLADADKNGDVASISSVSGGSITNAHAGIHRYRASSRSEVRTAAASLAGQIANRGSLFAWWGTWVYLVGLTLGVVAVVGIWFLPLPWWVRLLIFLVAFAAWDRLLLQRRGEICGRAYAATVLRTSPTAALNALAQPGIDHVVCATHLHAGEHFYFSGDFVYSYRFGWGAPGDLPLHVVVQASTALPGAFAPRWIRSSRLSLQGGAEVVPRLLGLVDGGVYDNMAEQWLTGLSRRTDGPTRLQQPDVIIVANASASMGMQPVDRMRWPFVGELLALLRDKSIMYDNSASIRKSDLVDRFDAFAFEGGTAGIGLHGCLLDIRSDPFSAARYFESQGRVWPERAERAAAVMACRRTDWASEAEFVSSVKTTLSKLGVEDSARIIRHAYILATMNLHLFLDYPLVDVPPLEEFENLCSE